MTTYSPTEGDVLELTLEERRYIVIDRVAGDTVYCRRVDDAGGLIKAVQMPITQFVRTVKGAKAKLHCGRKGW